MAEEEAQAPEENAENAENAEANEAAEATGDAAAEAPAEAPKPQSVWMPIMASSVISIVGAFALFQFVLGPKLITSIVASFDINGTPHAAAGHGEAEGGHGEAEGGHGEAEGGHGEAEGGHGEESTSGDSDEDNSIGEISIVGDEGQPIVINPANSGGTRYLLVDIYLVRKNEEDKKFKEAIDLHSKKLQSLTMDKLSEHDINQLSNPLVRKQIENDLMNQYQRILGLKEHPIKEIVVAKWIMQ